MGQDRESAKVLVVDDLEANRCILEEIIRNMGCCPVSARSGEEALRLMGQERPHLILSDISMPGMDGYELCRILKADRNRSGVSGSTARRALGRDYFRIR